MGRLFRKTGIIAAVLVFAQLIYHLALHVRGGGAAVKVFEYSGRALWFSVDLTLCLVGFFCHRLFAPKGASPKGASPKGAGLGKWLSALIAFVKWVLPAYGLFLFAYLGFGLRLQNALGNAFSLNEGYLPSFAFLYANFLFARGPLSGAALESLFLLCMAFQLFFGFGAVLAALKSRKAAPVLVIALWALAILLRLGYDGGRQWFTFFNTFTRMDSFLAGVLLAYLSGFEDVRKALGEKRLPILCLGVVALLGAAAFSKGLSRYEPMVDAVTNPPLALFSFAAVNWAFNSRLPRALSRLPRPDKATFAVYLVKHPVIYMLEGALFSVLGLPHSLAVNAVFIVGSVVVCYLIGFAWSFASDRAEALLTAVGARVRGLAMERRAGGSA